MILRYFNPCLEVLGLLTKITFADGEGLAMRFQITRTIQSTPDTCVVEIANLDPIRAKAMVAKFYATGAGQISVRGGYDRQWAGLFTGDLREVSSTSGGADQWLRLIADDGGDALADTVLRISTGATTSAGLTAKNMIDIAATAMGLAQSPGVATVLAASDPTTQGAYKAVSTARAVDLLDAACRRIRARWWVRDGTLYLGHRHLPDATRPAVVVPDSAITSPPSQDGAGLWRTGVFLDPRLLPGTQAVIQGTQQRIEAVVYSGETRGGLWTAAVTGRTL